jgi:hypothetical protein
MIQKQKKKPENPTIFKTVGFSGIGKECAIKASSYRNNSF